MSPVIDSQPGGPVRQPYLTYWPARIHRLAESISGLLNVNKFGHNSSNRVVISARRAGNRFLGSLKSQQIRALLAGTCQILGLGNTKYQSYFATSVNNADVVVRVYDKIQKNLFQQSGALGKLIHEKKT